MSPPDHLSRREFLGQAAAGAVAVSALGARARAQEPRAKVVMVTCPEVIAEGQPCNRDVLRRMMDRGIAALAGVEDVAAAWRTFVQPTDKVALVDAGTWLMNVPEVPVEVARGIKLAGPAEMTFTYCTLSGQNSFWLNEVKTGLQREGISPEVMDGSVYVFPGKFHTRPFNVIVSTPTLKSHTICGVSGVVKHYATLAKDHVKIYHPNAMETCGSVLANEFKDHRHLVIVDALRWGKVREGPQFYQQSLIFGADPVATDVIALEVYLRNCTTHNDIPPDLHRRLAGERYHAGISDRARIDLLELTI